MNEEEFATEMARIAKEFDWDTETAHSKADDLLCSMLYQLGFDKGVNIFKDMRKWYA